MQISDPKAIRALAHPLRLDLLELLTAIGPSTAAHCGRVLQVPQANCSFHLRQLAKYGFVEDAGPGADRRERTWRVPEPRPTLRIGSGGDDVVRRQLKRLVVERETQAILDYVDRQDDEAGDSAEDGAEGPDPGWGGSPGIVAAVAVVSADEADEIRAKWQELLAPYLARTADGGQLHPGQRRVRYFMAGTPMPDFDLGDTER
ncbi:helix-turn-helix domain-containing protein [Streptomyces sp. NPDC051976]|uniref:helix-turn-helix domain-containing protein n=1 Tax=Streptomyces sp. NPDC051976 TaxID=3154947 RepID=UPI003415F78F